MSLESKVVWSEGMFLNPQHFQQQDRYFERYINSKVALSTQYGWGVDVFELDTELLKLGKLSVLKARGVFPDGTPFSIPDLNAPPPVIELGENLHNVTVSLAIPVKRPGAVDVLPAEDTQGFARFSSTEFQVRDVVQEGGDNVKIDVAGLRLKMLLATDDQSGYACIAVLNIAETREDKNIILDEQFFPTALSVSASTKLSGFLNELVGLLRHRADAIAGRLADTRRGGTGEVADYLMLQMINRVEPLMHHYAHLQGLHPLTMFNELVQIAGEMATFVASDKRAPKFGHYLHDDLTKTFTPVMSLLREYLSMVYEQTAVALPLAVRKYGIRVSEISDRSMLSSASFILAARADVAEELIRKHLPAQLKIAPVEKIRQLVNAAMPGIPMKVLPVAPRQIPYRAGYAYFELEKNCALWNDLQTSGGFAMHLGGDFPGLEFEFWSVRQQ